LQRVARAAVEVADERVAAIGRGLLVLVGVEAGDDEAEAAAAAEKIATLRVFEDERGRMNRDLGAVGGSVLVVSQFTLVADLRRGRRPSFDGAAPATQAETLVESVVARLRQRGCLVETGRFGANMRVELVNEGPVTLVFELPPRGG
jgi:D-tyrosyl-tRNA(Tyr) deacylase